MFVKTYNHLNVSELFRAHYKEFGEFGRVENKLDSRMDLHALVLLAKLFPSEKRIISEFGLSWFCIGVTPKQVESLTSEQVLELVRCGVRYDDNNGDLIVYL